MILMISTAVHVSVIIEIGTNTQDRIVTGMYSSSPLNTTIAETAAASRIDTANAPA